MVKHELIEKLELLRTIGFRHEVDMEILNEIDKTINEVDGFELRIPVIGGFNAGKSSLINAFLQRDILPVETLPETAIAAEIRYNINEKVIAHKADGTHQIFSINNIRDINAKDYNYIEVHVNSEKVKSLGNAVLVDMPGFDSGIKEHNKAIFQYIREGAVFAVIVDCEDGGIKSSVLNFLYELDMYKLSFGVAVNKIDKKMKSDVDKIVSNIQRVVSGLGKDITVERTSDRIQDGDAGFERLLQGFNEEKIIRDVFSVKINILIQRITDTLTVLFNNSDLDAKEINKRIEEINRKLKEVNEEFKVEEVKISRKIRGEIKDNILGDVRKSLMSNSASLAKAALAGESAFNLRINEVIRPVLMSSTNRNLQVTFSELINKISVSMIDASEISQGINKTMEFTEKSLGLMKDTIETIAKNPEMLKKFEKVYKVVTGGLAILTGVVAPWVELVIFFLPDILKLLGVGDEKRQLEKIERQIQNEVIPQIINKLEESIVPSLEELKNELISELKNEVEAKTKDLENALQQSISNKEEKKLEFEQYKKELKEDIEETTKLTIE